MEFKVGDTVTFNGSSICVRMYVGQIVEVRENTYIIVDNEWFARSEVAKSRVKAYKEEE